MLFDAIHPELHHLIIFNNFTKNIHFSLVNNLTLKTFAAFDLMQNFCSQDQFLLKTDDDMFIQVSHKVLEA